MGARRVRPLSATTSLEPFLSNSLLLPKCSISTQLTTRVASRARTSVPKKCRLLTASNAFKTTSASSGMESIAKFLVVLVSIIYIIPIHCFLLFFFNRTCFLLDLVCLSSSGDRTDKLKKVRIRISAWLKFRKSPLMILVFETKQWHKQTNLSYLVCVTDRFSGLNRYLKLRKPQARGNHSGIRWARKWTLKTVAQAFQQTEGAWRWTQWRHYQHIHISCQLNQ